MDNNLKVLGALEGSKKEVADSLSQSFRQKYPSVEGEMYLGYPIYHDEVTRRKVCVDIALISKIGVFIINILDVPMIDYGEIQDDIYAKVESKFKKQPFLFFQAKEAYLRVSNDYLLRRPNGRARGIFIGKIE